MDVKEKVDDFGKPLFEVSSDKMVAKLIVKKEFNGFAFYVIQAEKGQVPDRLSGRYTNHERALADIKVYLANKPLTKTAKRNRNTEAREKQKQDAARAKPDNSEHIREGASD